LFIPAVSQHSRVGLRGLHPGGDQVVRDLALGEGGEGAAGHRFDPERSREKEHSARQLRQRRHRLEHPRREVLVGIAVGQDQAADAVGVGGHQHLRNRSAGVVADDRHVFELELGEELGDQPRYAGGGEVGIAVHCRPVRGDRPIGCDAAEAIREAIDDPIPKPPVDQVAVDEDDGFTLACLSVADGSLGKLNFLALVRHDCLL
jgi:hypothetical protein